MLSNKWTFSLKVLVLLVTVGFIATPAMAGEFDVTLDMMGDKSSADGLQVIHPGDGEDIEVTVKFAQAVKLDAATVFVTTYDKYDKLVSIAVATGDPAKTVASKEFTLTIPVKQASVKVNIKIAKGIVSADPINADTSKALDVNVGLIGSDDADPPTVYSIRRADNPLLPVTAATFQVIVTLSEMPKEFKKGNLSITDNATLADPVALDPIAEDPNRFRNIRLADLQAIADADPPPMRGLYDEDRDGDDTIEVAAGGDDLPRGIHAALNGYKATTDLGKAITAYNTAATLAGAPATVLVDRDTTTSDVVDVFPTTEVVDANTMGEHVIGIHPPFKTYELTATAVVYRVATWASMATDTVIQKAIDVADASAAAADSVVIDRTTAPTMPVATDYLTQAAFVTALELYELLSRQHALYNAELALYKAYMKAVMAEMETDEEAITDYYATQHGTVLESATGRDNMLHPYVVTITPKYPAGKADIVLKVVSYEDTNIPIAGKYTLPIDEDDEVEGVHKLTIKVGKEILTALESGTPLYLPHGEGAMIPASGFYLLTKNKDGSGIAYSHEKDDENKAHKQTPEQLKFNVRAEGIPNLESNLANGATIDLVAYDGTAATAAYISEVMWGSDASQAPNASNSQWIEIANTTASAIAVGEKKWALWTYQPHETPPSAYTGGTLIDRLSTIRADWTLAGKGQSGRTGVDPGGADVVAIAPTQPLVSMVRVTDAAGAPVDGTLPTSWVASGGPKC